MKSIKHLLEKHQGLDGWRISQKATRSYELFFVHRKLETVRSTDTLSTDVTVYVNHDGKTGDSSFAVYPSMTENDLEKKIASAAQRARLVDNQPYQLPEAGVLSASLPGNIGDFDPKALGAKIADAVFAADTVPGGSINACEIFLYQDTVHVENSRGVDKTQVIHRVMIEAIPTFTDSKESVELYEDYHFTQFDPARVTREIAEKMREVRDRAAAVRPKTPMKISVLLRPNEIAELVGEMAFDLNYAAVYGHANLHTKGDDLQPGSTGDKLTITLRAMTPGSEQSAYFDQDGTALRDTCILREGVAADYFGASRFGQYLGIENPSGDLRCVKVEAGTLTENEIAQAPYLECVSLSGLQVDLYNDYIGGEIRLAYYFDGEKKIPVTGISMSGKLSDALAQLRLSQKTDVQGAYEGPSLMMLKDISIL